MRSLHKKEERNSQYNDLLIILFLFIRINIINRKYHHFNEKNSLLILIYNFGNLHKL